MDVLTLSRVQFGATISFHYIYPPLSIGLGVMLVLMEGLWLKTGKPVYHQSARYWTKVFALTFAMGVATGIVMEFEFGTNWATYSRFVGDVFGSALAAEGIFAFFLEAGFLAVLLFGWDKVGRGLHFFSTCMVCLGAHFSAVWIVVANSWMQTPAGYHLVGEGMKARAEITDFWQMVLNPSTVDPLVPHPLRRVECGGISRGQHQRLVSAEENPSGVRPGVLESRPGRGARGLAVAGGHRTRAARRPWPNTSQPNSRPSRDFIRPPPMRRSRWPGGWTKNTKGLPACGFRGC